MIDVCLTDGLQKPRQQLHYLPEEGVWYVHCRHCENEATLQVALREWRLEQQGYQRRWWFCPECYDSGNETVSETE